MNAEEHFASATMNIPNDAEVEPLTPPTKDMGLDTIFLETTTMGIADTLPIYHTLCSSNTKDKLITSLPSISSMMGERVHSTVNSCPAIADWEVLMSMPCWKLKQRQYQTSFKTTYRQLQRIWFASFTSLEQIPFYQLRSGRTWLYRFFQLADLLKESIEPRSAKHNPQNFILVGPLIFIPWLPGASAKTPPPGHIRDWPPRTSDEHSCQEVLLSLYDGRRRGRPQRSAVETFLLQWSHRQKRHRCGRPPNKYSSLRTDNVSIFFNIRLPATSCFIYVLLGPHVATGWCLSFTDYTSSLSKRGVVVDAQYTLLQIFLVIAFMHNDSGPGSQLRHGMPQWRINTKLYFIIQLNNCPEDITTFGNRHLAAWCSFWIGCLCNYISKNYNYDTNAAANQQDLASSINCQ